MYAPPHYLYILHFSEFDKQTIHEILNGFGLTRSLIKQGCLYDNAVAESTNMTLTVSA